MVLNLDGKGWDKVLRLRCGTRAIRADLRCLGTSATCCLTGRELN